MTDLNHQMTLNCGAENTNTHTQREREREGGRERQRERERDTTGQYPPAKHFGFTMTSVKDDNDDDKDGSNLPL